MRFIRLLALASVIAFMGVASPASAQKADKQALDSIAFVNGFPLAFVYEGFGRFQAKDYDGARRVWEEYLKKAGTDADTALVNPMIREAVILAYPEALLYQAVALVKTGDTLGAVRAWERFLDVAPAGADTAAVRQLAEDVFAQAYPLARLYQGLGYFAANDYAWAITAWEKYLALGATEKERTDVQGLIATARDLIETERVAARSKTR